MVRKYARKTTRANTPPDIMLKAVRAIKLDNLTVRQVAEKFGINYRTLTRYCKKIPEEELLCKNITTPTIPVGYVKVRQIFTNSQEKELVKYIKHVSDICLGLSVKEVKILAYYLARYNSVKMPASWIKNKMAGDDWFNALMRRHSDLPIQKSETTSKATESFSRINVELFYKNLEKVMSSYHFKPEDIWNMDEIGITTLQVSDRIVTRRNHKQIGNNVLAAYGNLVTMACTISAKGDHIPPFFASPRVHFKDHFIASASAGSSGTANKLGWMEEKDFEKFLRYFHAHAKCSIEKPVLLLLDQQSLHLSIESLNYTKENGIVMLCFPQYCSYKLQPLDRTIFEPLREHVNSASNTWVLNNPNHTMNIYNIPEIVAVAYPLAMTSTNIQAGFKCTGIFPYNNDVFSDLDFEPNFITIKPYFEENVVMKNNYGEQTIEEDMIKVETASFCSSDCDVLESIPEKSDEVFKISSDEEKEKMEGLHPSSEAVPRRSPRKYAKRQVVTAVTDTPVRRKLKLENIENKNTNKRKRIKITLKNNIKKMDKKTKDSKKSTKKSEEIKQVTKCKKITKKTKALKEKDCFCTICLKPDHDSLSRQKWVHCIHCKEWSHETCIPVISNYTCHTCEST